MYTEPKSILRNLAIRQTSLKVYMRLYLPAAPFPLPTATKELMDLFLLSLAVTLNALLTCQSNNKHHI